MRILLIIVMILAMLVATGMGLMIGNENLLSENADKLTKLVEMAGDSELATTAKGYQTAGQGGFIVALLALVMVIVTFTKKTKAIQIVAGITVLMGLVFIGMSPGAEASENGPASPRMQAMVFCIAAMIVAACGFGAEQIRLKKAD